MIEIGRSSMLILPGRTYLSITVGSESRVYSAQKGHWRSTNSIIVAGASGSPSVAPSCGIPRKRCATSRTPAIDSPPPRPDSSSPPLWLTAMRMPTTASAATVDATRRISRRLRRSAAAAAASRASRSSRRRRFCSVLLAMVLLSV